VTVALIGLLASLAAPAAAVVPARDRYAVGDSVMLGARSALKETGFGVDAAVSRQAYSAPALLRKKGAKLPENVVVHLGTNGTFPLSTCKALVRAAGPERRVFLVTVHVRRSWAKSNNAMMRKCDAAFADERVHVIDWDQAASKNRSWLYSDGIHLRPRGAAAFTRLLDSSVDAVVARAREQARVEAIAEATGSGRAALM
jgi:hypothetical protein